MLRIIRQLPPLQSALAIAFLLVQTGSALYLPYLTAGMVDQGVIAHDVGHIWRQGAGMLAFAVLSLAGALLNIYLAGNVAFGVGEELRGAVFAKALGFSKAEYDRFGTSGIVTRATNDVTQVQTVVEMFLKFLILSPLYLAGGIYLTWRLDPALAVPFLAVVPFMALSAVVVHRSATPLYGRMQELLDRLNLLFREGVTGVRVIRAFTREDDDRRKYGRVNHEYTGVSVRAATVMSVFTPLTTLILNAATVSVMWIGGNSAAAGTTRIGAVMAAVTYSGQILLGFALLTNVILTLPRGQVSARRIHEILEVSPTVREPSRPRPVHGVSLEFDAVGFRYPGAAERAVDGVSLRVERGCTLAVVGGTGEGKSSLLNLVPRLYDPEAGSVRVGGTDVRYVGRARLNALVSHAPQKSSLLAGTIRDNLLPARPDATDEEIWAALRVACATEFVERLPDGLDSRVEKGGGNFSGGQRQRLCIARTVLKDADIYLFDDAFSALDLATDAIVRARLRERLREKVTVVVAQRVSTVSDADLILVLDRGRAAGVGTHPELLAANPVYREIVSSQARSPEVAA